MANIRSAEKQHRQSLKKRSRNRAAKTRLRSQIKTMRTAIESGDETQIRSTLSETYSVIDKTAKKKVIQGNTADRYKARLSAAAKKAATAK